MGASSITLSGVTDVPTLESMACREAQALALDLLASRDCNSVMQDTKANMGGAHVAVIKEVNDRKGDFQDCCFIHESIRKKYEVDSLAKFSLSLDFGTHRVVRCVPHVTPNRTRLESDFS